MTSWNENDQTVTVGALAVLVRGWLHGNVIRVGHDLIDTGYHNGVDELRAWLRGPVERIFLTHVHSDHSGGVHAFQDTSTVYAHPDARAIVDPWDRDRLWINEQELPRFSIDEDVGDRVDIGGVNFDVIHVPGHATGGVAYLSDDGVMIVGDALWANGFGLLHPAVDGPQVFEEAATALDRIQAAAPRLVIPGHGAPFTDVTEALVRARRFLEGLHDPAEFRRRTLMGRTGFRALMHPEFDRDVLRDLLIRDGARPDEVWVEPLLRRFRP